MLIIIVIIKYNNNSQDNMIIIVNHIEMRLESKRNKNPSSVQISDISL